jgi:hypothetical protein
LSHATRQALATYPEFPNFFRQDGRLTADGAAWQTVAGFQKFSENNV